MGWASMVRGQFLRAWRHAWKHAGSLRSPWIAEHWWNCETERIAALAIAATCFDAMVAAPGLTPMGIGRRLLIGGSPRSFTHPVLERSAAALKS